MYEIAKNNNRASSPENKDVYEFKVPTRKTIQ